MSAPPPATSPGRLRDKVAIVTGGSSSIGRAISLAYAKEGAKVVVADIRDSSRAPSEAEAPTHELIRKQGGEAEFMKLDVTNLENVEQVVRDTVAKFGRLDMYCSISFPFCLGLSDIDTDGHLDTSITLGSTTTMAIHSRCGA